MRLTPITLDRLALQGLKGVWYRCFPKPFAHRQLALSYSKKAISRFNPGWRLPLSLQFQLLYLAEDDFVAKCEFRALVGSPLTGQVVPLPGRNFVLTKFSVSLKAVVDLCNVAATQTLLHTDAQELTGDWQGNHLRLTPTVMPGISVPEPTHIAPTQELGLALRQNQAVEAFVSVSSVVPTRRTLGIFTGNLQPGSFVEYTLDGTTHRLQDDHVDGQPLDRDGADLHPRQ